MEYHLAASVPDKAKDVMDIEVTAEGAGDKRHFSFPVYMKRIGMSYEGTFMHPPLADGHWLKEHRLYSIEL